MLVIHFTVDPKYWWIGWDLLWIVNCLAQRRNNKKNRLDTLTAKSNLSQGTPCPNQQEVV